MDEQFVLKILKDVSNIVKEYDHLGEIRFGKRNDPKKPYYPEYYKGYNAVVEQWQDNLVHAELGVFAEKLMGKKAPNQSQEEFDYLKGIYEQLTLPVYVDYSNSIKRAFNDGNWSIEYPDPDKKDVKYKGENSIEEYLRKGIDTYGSLESFMKMIFVDLQAKDPNGGIGVFSKFELTQEGDTVLFAERTDEARRPSPHYFNCSRIVQYEEGKWYLVETSEKCMVEIGGGKKKVGRVYMWFDDEKIYKIFQTGKFIDYEFVVIQYMEHELKYVPFKRNGGMPRIHEGNLLYDSAFSFAVGLLNLVIINGNYLQACVNNCVYPQRVMLGDECDFEDNGVRCFEGKLIDPMTNTSKTCSKCQGTGMKTRAGAMGTIFVRKNKAGEPEAKASDIVHFASPSTETLEFLMKKIDSDEKRARNILHLYTSTTEVKGSESQTATQSSIDQKAHYAFIKPISDSIFAMYRFIVKTIGLMREGAAYQPINITSPITFDFYTEQDYLDQLESARASNMPPYVIYSILWKYLASLYYTEKKTAEVFRLILDSDRIATLTNQEVMSGVQNGSILLYEKVLHESAITFVNELILSDPSFLDKDLEIKKTQLIEKAKLKAKEIEEEMPDPADLL